MTTVAQSAPPKDRRIFFVKTISLIVTIVGLTVMAGWIFDIGVLKSLSLAWVSMKFSTAFAFVVSGVTLYFLARTREGEFEKAQVALSITSLTLTLLMGLLFFAAIFGISTGIESLFTKETDSLKSVAPGQPSLPTMLNFMLIALAAILNILHPVRHLWKMKIIGSVVSLVGIAAVAGYIFNAPTFYYYIHGISSAMALHTALLFVLLGTGLLCL